MSQSGLRIRSVSLYNAALSSDTSYQRPLILVMEAVAGGFGEDIPTFAAFFDDDEVADVTATLSARRYSQTFSNGCESQPERRDDALIVVDF